jgi:hypothetical protein
MEKINNLREHLAPVIEDAITGIDKDDIRQIREALKEAYPFESTREYAYQVWLKEVHCQLGFKLKRSRKHKDQLELFE